MQGVKWRVAKPYAILVIILATAIPVALTLQLEFVSSGGNYGKKVLAFYYTWYGNTTAYDGENPGTENAWLHWSENGHTPPGDLAANHTPVLGAFDSANNDTLAQHLAWAQTAGIDAFIATWWGPGGFEDFNFNKSLRYTQDHALAFEWTVYFESVQSRFVNNGTQIYKELRYIIESYASHPKFMKVDGRPVIFAYVIGHPGLSAWAEARQLLQADGLNPFLVGDIGTPGMPSAEVLEIFDGVHVYNPAGPVKEGKDYHGMFQELIFGTHLRGRLACYTVSPGYNDFNVCNCGGTGRNTWWELPRKNGDVYKAMWGNATSSRADWILICTFNEWHEGSEIEPSVQYGTKYIDLTGQYAPAWKSNHT